MLTSQNKARSVVVFPPPATHSIREQCQHVHSRRTHLVTCPARAPATRASAAKRPEVVNVWREARPRRVYSLTWTHLIQSSLRCTPHTRTAMKDSSVMCLGNEHTALEELVQLKVCSLTSSTFFPHYSYMCPLLLFFSGDLAVFLAIWSKHQKTMHGILFGLVSLLKAHPSKLMAAFR